jgi:hypothetical protein
VVESPREKVAQPCDAPEAQSWAATQLQAGIFRDEVDRREPLVPGICRTTNDGLLSSRVLTSGLAIIP